MINYGYFRHRFDAHTNSKLNAFADDVGLVGFAYYYLLLELYGAYISKSDDHSCAKIHQRVLANTWRKRVDSADLVVTKLQLSGLLVSTLSDSTYTIAIPNYLKYFGSYKKTDMQKPPNKRKEKEIKEKKSKTNKSNVADGDFFDLEELYLAYPKKEGKKRGMEILRSKIKTQQDYDDLKAAVNNYVQLSKSEDRKFFKHFSTFANNYEDYISVDIPETTGFAYLDELAEQMRREPSPFWDRLNECSN